jgi:hypothetical protein
MVTLAINALDPSSFRANHRGDVVPGLKTLGFADKSEKRQLFGKRRY